VTKALRLSGGLVLVVLIVATTAYLLRATPTSQMDTEHWLRLSSSSGDLPIPWESDQQTASLVLDVDQCQWRTNFPQKLECAPEAGQNQAAVLTVCRAWWSSNWAGLR
jgi:hypothetical protein